MSTTDSTYQPVPRDFDEYLQVEQAQPLGRCQCTGCFRDDLHVWHWGTDPNVGNDLCEACWRTMHGVDREEQTMVFSMIASAVEGALAAGASRELVRAAVDEAVARDEQRERDDLEHLFAKWQAPGGPLSSP